MRHPSVMVLLAMSLAAAGGWCALREAARVDGVSAAASAVRVLDGDSLVLGEARVRLRGIDAPELSQPCRGEGGRAVACGRMARAALARMVGGAGRVTCIPEGKDRYRRTLAVCRTAEGLELNRAMVREGWALAWQDDPDYLAEERRAARARRGIHAFGFVDPQEWRRGRRG